MFQKIRGVKEKVKIMEAMMIVIGVCVTAALLIAVAATVDGYVLSILWGWFMVPSLGLPPLGVVQAIGVALVVGLLTRKGNNCSGKTETTESEGAWELLKGLIAKPALILLFGWIIHKLM